MANFLLLYIGGRMPEGEAETKQVMGAWDQWMGRHHDAIVDAGNPFTPNPKTITGDGRVSDGVSGEQAGGYSVIRADSLDEAVRIAKECPVFLGGAKLALYETFDVMAAAGAEHHNH